MKGHVDLVLSGQILIAKPVMVRLVPVVSFHVQKKNWSLVLLKARFSKTGTRRRVGLARTVGPPDTGSLTSARQRPILIQSTESDLLEKLQATPKGRNVEGCLKR